MCHRARCALTTASRSFCSKSRFSTQPSQVSPCAKSSSRNCLTRSLEKSSSGRNAAAVVRHHMGRATETKTPGVGGGGLGGRVGRGELQGPLGYICGDKTTESWTGFDTWTTEISCQKKEQRLVISGWRSFVVLLSWDFSQRQHHPPAQHAANQEGVLRLAHNSSMNNNINKSPFTCFASLRVVANSLLALLAVSQPLDERIEWLSLELSLIDKVANTAARCETRKREKEASVRMSA